MFQIKLFRPILPTIRCFSVAVDAELTNAKPYEAIPQQSFLSREFLPGGKLFNVPMDKWHIHFLEKHGKLIRFPPMLGKPEMVISYDPEDIKKVYQLEGQWPHRLGLETWLLWREGNALFKNFKGLVLQQGDTWQKYRTILNPVMMKPKIVSLYVPEIDAVARDFIEVTRKSLDSKSETPANYGVFIHRYTMEAIGTIAFETRLGVLEPKEGNVGTELVKHLDDIFVLTFKLEGRPSLWKIFKTPNFYKLMKAFDKSSEIIRGFVDAAIERFEKEGSQKSEDLQGVLYKLLQVDKECAIIMGIDFLSVGIDTTGSSIKNLLYLLAKNPDKQQKLREEILRILPSKNDALTTEKMNHMPYLRACMKESQRLQPIVLGNARRMVQDAVLQGYRVPKGIDVILAHGVIANTEEHFGKADQYIPERWLKDEREAESVGCPHAKTVHPYTYLPFGFGARACIGKRFADLEISVLTTRMVREFELSWNYPPPKFEQHIITQMTSDVKLTLKPI